MNTNTNISIAEISSHDVNFLVDNFCFTWNTPEQTREKWERCFDEHQQGARIVALVKCYNETLGYGSLLFESEYLGFAGVPEISDVWIHENHRGLGCGTALIKQFETLAREQGYSEIGIGVGLYADYGNAQQLYVKLGYVPDGNGITYKYQKTVPGTSYPLDDDLILWLKKTLK